MVAQSMCKPICLALHYFHLFLTLYVSHAFIGMSFSHVAYWGRPLPCPSTCSTHPPFRHLRHCLPIERFFHLPHLPHQLQTLCRLKFQHLSRFSLTICLPPRILGLAPTGPCVSETRTPVPCPHIVFATIPLLNPSSMRFAFARIDATSRVSGHRCRFHVASNFDSGLLRK
ncbi:hypothetical protein BU26DRAFT_155373 [Trematosphaeria pertusa]|uniref:Uncharacterized protein n=1 Tax=Trematosphaeria pertusa TaxID=390896 RepID=A0A6A6IZS6_9PLEO|nr:uncharacterized protein BU26DRAFT_155373 [Trematosphaeria pertusa]KAF2255402.1 hypothetical protein BU26DRAFT_155373 [Trematosphaeria pertusa]